MPSLSLEDLENVSIQSDVAKEAFTQVEKRLSDLLETKKSFESRATSMLSVFVTLALAFTGVGASFFTSQALIDHAPRALPWVFFATAVPLLLAAWSMMDALRPTEYGNLGTSPALWLEQGWLDAPDNVVPAMQAYMVWHMQGRIDLTERANKQKADFIMQGAFLATISPAVMALALCFAWAVT